MLIFLLLTVATAILVQRQGQGADATAINVAGRQRMLSQKMAKEALGIVHGDRPIQAQEQLRQTRDLFERGLSGLIEGDRDPGLGQEQDPANPAAAETSADYVGADAAAGGPIGCKR